MFNHHVEFDWGSAEGENEKPSVPKCSEGLRKLLGNSASSLAVFYVEQVALNRHVFAATAAALFMPERPAEVNTNIAGGNGSGFDYPTSSSLDNSAAAAQTSTTLIYFTRKQALRRGRSLNPIFLTIFIFFMLSGFIVGGSYLWIKLQVWKAGDRSNIFNLSHDTVMLGRYRELARAQSVPLWPLYLYWASLIVTAALGVGLMAAFH